MCSTAFVANTTPLPCVFHCLRGQDTAFSAKTLPFALCVSLPSWLRHCLSLRSSGDTGSVSLTENGDVVALYPVRTVLLLGLLLGLVMVLVQLPPLKLPPVLVSRAPFRARDVVQDHIFTESKR